MKTESKQFKYNKQRLTQFCVEGSREGFNSLHTRFSIDVITDCIAFALRHGHIELAEYIMSIYPNYKETALFSYRGIGRIKGDKLIKIIKSINNKKEIPNLYKIRKRFLNESIERFWRGHKIDNLIICLNRLPSGERKKKIDEYSNWSTSSENIRRMKEGLKIFLREETINKILG